MSRENKDKRFEIRLSEAERERFFTAAEVSAEMKRYIVTTSVQALSASLVVTKRQFVNRGSKIL